MLGGFLGPSESRDPLGLKSTQIRVCWNVTQDIAGQLLEELELPLGAAEFEQEGRLHGRTPKCKHHRDSGSH